ncbi:DUF1187 family protein [Salmonella enterica]|nr:DUF1187 family protein [Salmonella enterica]
MYKITATIVRAGGLPVDWIRYSSKKLSKDEYEKMLSKSYQSG